MRRLADDDGKRVKLVVGRSYFAGLGRDGGACWVVPGLVRRPDSQWAGYLNSQCPGARAAKLFTYEHIHHWLTCLEWICAGSSLPAKVIPYAVATAQWGWRMPWRRVLRILWNWRWWPAVVVAPLLAVWLPAKSFTELPHGTVSAQVWWCVETSFSLSTRRHQLGSPVGVASCTFWESSSRIPLKMCRRPFR